MREIKNMNIFDLINSLGEIGDRIKVIESENQELDSGKLGLLNEAHRNIGGAYIALNNYLEDDYV